GLPPYANDMVGLLGGDQQAMVHSLRSVEPVSSFRSTFAYTNITHILAQRIVAEQLGAKDWDAVVRAEIFEPLGMKASSLTAEAMPNALGWATRATPNARIIWHSGATDSFGAYAGYLPDKDVGVVVLTNESNVGFPDAIGEWVFDRFMDNPVVDNVAVRLSEA